MATITGTDERNGIYDTIENDTINALGGDDDVGIIRGGFDTVDGGTGTDLLWFRMEFFTMDRGAFTLNSTQNGGSISGQASFLAGGTITTFSNIENIKVNDLRGNFNDSITTGAGDDLIQGEGGMDVINLGGGFDTVIYRFLSSSAVVMTVQSNDANGANGVVDAGTARLDFTGIDKLMITTGVGNDTLNGGEQGDTLDASEGTNVINGNGGADTLRSNGTNDTINGGEGNDFIDYRGTGGTLNGDAGDDIIRFERFAANLAANGGTGNDVLQAHVQGFESFITMAAPTTDPNGGYQGVITQNERFGVTIQMQYSGIERFDIRGGVRDDNITTGDGDDVVSCSDGNDIINTAGGNDTVTGGTGTKTINTGDGDDAVSVGSGTVNGGAGNDILTAGGTINGGEGNDTINLLGGTANGGNGNDTINGSFGVDTIDGGDGDDIIRGDGGADTLGGGAGADDIDGGSGIDQMTGGMGNDIYRIDTVSDAVFENAGEGTDTIITSLRGYSLSGLANVENLSTISDLGVRYSGNDGDNVITGAAGADTLIGLLGADTLIGGAGSDSYLVSDGRAVIVEAANGGSDTVYVTVDYRLTPGAHVETLTPYERELTDPLRLTGNEFANTIYGNAGNNVLTGLGGADTLYGLAGDDAYLVDDNLDTIVEQDGQGYDTVYTEGDFALNNFSYVEALSVYDRDTTNAVTLFGNNLNNVIYGNNGANALYGGGGTDTLYGMGGNDSFIIDSADDVVIEFAGGGTDTVYTTVTYALAATDAEVEVLTVYDRDTVNAVNLTGNGIANTIYGNAGANTLDGKGGNDLLFGMGGADSFAFTTALGAGNADTIFGFVGGAGGDRILLDDAVFSGLAPGSLPAGAFATGSAAVDADDRIVYNQATGQLFFDADGNGADAQVLFATLNGAPVLTASDFMVI